LIEPLTPLKQQNHFLEQSTHLMSARTGTHNLVASHYDRDIGERIFDPTQEFISRAKKFRHEM
jgi:hypothetical protein